MGELLCLVFECLCMCSCSHGSNEGASGQTTSWQNFRQNIYFFAEVNPSAMHSDHFSKTNMDSLVPSLPEPNQHNIHLVRRVGVLWQLGVQSRWETDPCGSLLEQIVLGFGPVAWESLRFCCSTNCTISTWPHLFRPTTDIQSFLKLFFRINGSFSALLPIWWDTTELKRGSVFLVKMSSPRNWKKTLLGVHSQSSFRRKEFDLLVNFHVQRVCLWPEYHALTALLTTISTISTSPPAICKVNAYVCQKSGVTECSTNTAVIIAPMAARSQTRRSWSNHPVTPHQTKNNRNVQSVELDLYLATKESVLKKSHFVVYDIKKKTRKISSWNEKYVHPLFFLIGDSI